VARFSRDLDTIYAIFDPFVRESHVSKGGKLKQYTCLNLPNNDIQFPIYLSYFSCNRKLKQDNIGFGPS